MGPYAAALSWIIANAAQRRIDINTDDFKNCQLFRGTGFTLNQIDEIRQISQNYYPDNKMRLYGWTSTSRNKSAAESFAYNNPNGGLKRVLLHIYWNQYYNHYYMN